MDTMEKLLANLLHVSVREQEFNKGMVPLFLTGLYDIKAFDIDNQLIYLVHPKEQVSLPDLKKHLVKLKTLLGENCILYDDGYTRYGIARLIEMGVPFIFGDNNIYLPNFGIRIHEKTSAQLPDAERFSPFTQKLILTALYHGWTYISGKEISEKMQVSRMTVNRALLELEALELPLTEMSGKSRYFKNDLSREEFLKICKEFFISPVKKTLRLMKIPETVCIKSGLSALAAYTMLSDDLIPTYAVNQEQYRNLELGGRDLAPKGELPSCFIQIHRYLIIKDGTVDPVSTVLSVPDEERNDVRIEQAIDMIWDGVYNGRWIG